MNFERPQSPPQGEFNFDVPAREEKVALQEATPPGTKSVPVNDLTIGTIVRMSKDPLGTNDAAQGEEYIDKKVASVRGSSDGSLLVSFEGEAFPHPYDEDAELFVVQG